MQVTPFLSDLFFFFYRPFLNEALSGASFASLMIFLGSLDAFLLFISIP